MQLWLKFYLRVVGVSRRNGHDAGLPRVREFSCMECVELGTSMVQPRFSHTLPQNSHNKRNS